jgi:hypothetical protein
MLLDTGDKDESSREMEGSSIDHTADPLDFISILPISLSFLEGFIRVPKGAIRATTGERESSTVSRTTTSELRLSLAAVAVIVNKYTSPTDIGELEAAATDM